MLAEPVTFTLRQATSQILNAYSWLSSEVTAERPLNFKAAITGTIAGISFLFFAQLDNRYFERLVQAYSEGMPQIVDETANRMYLSLSIAPLIPSRYVHARRLSCDTKGHISGSDQTTEYMLNSLTYGRWTSKNLYIADPDHVVFG